MKTLLITGFACNKAAWSSIFSHNQEDFFHFTFADQLKQSKKGDLRQLARVTAKIISDMKPDVLVLHDFGVTSGLLGLLRAQKKVPTLCPKLIIFDGAMRGFDVFKTPHPFWIQFMSPAQIKKGVLEAGGTFDEELLLYLSEIKAIYRQVIAVSLKEKWDNLLKKNLSQKWNVNAPSLIIASPNDMFTTPICLKYLAEDLVPKAKLIEIAYGHFPYSIGSAPLREAINDFIK